MPFDPNDESFDFFQYIPDNSSGKTASSTESDPEPNLLNVSSADPQYETDIFQPLFPESAEPIQISEDTGFSPPSLPVVPEADAPCMTELPSSVNEASEEHADLSSDEKALFTDGPVSRNEGQQQPFLPDISPESYNDEKADAPSDSAKKKPSVKTGSQSGKNKATTGGKKIAVRKGRPRRRKGEGFLGIPNMLVTVVWCSLILLIGLTLGRMMWLCAAEVLAFGRNDISVKVTILETDTIDDIATKLAREGLIQYRGLFKLYARFAVDDGDIKPGTWELNTKYDYHALVNGMAPSSTRSVVKIMIPEGYTCRQIFALLEEKNVCSARSLEDYAAGGDLGDYWFLSGVARGDQYCLEGFLFPDTYEFYTNDTPRNVLSKMLNNFDSKFDNSMIWKISQLNDTLTSLMRRGGKSEAFITEHQFTVLDVVNVASMIEKETSSAEEGYTIASVIYNRLFNWGSTPAYLNIDATIVYAANGDNEDIAANLNIDSPYNTYTHTGLTPGPISNPGLSSLKAALEPASTNYYYYVLDSSAGHHIFATTQAEHDANVAKVNGRS